MGAIFRQIGVFVNEGPLKFHMAASAHILDIGPFEVEILACTMGFMAVDTGHFMLGKRMARKLGEFHTNRLVAIVAEFVHLLPIHLLLRTPMQLVAVEAADVAVGMGAGVPVMEIGCGGGRMALQTDERLSLSGKFLQWQQGFELAALFPGGSYNKVFNGNASGPMTGLAVDQRQTAVARDLFAMHRHLEIPLESVMLVASGETLFVADIIGVESPDNHSFIFSNRLNGMIGTQ